MAGMRGRWWGWAAALCGAPLRPLRSPRGLLAASVARGLVMVPGFLLSARLGAPAFVMGVLTLALGLSNGWVWGGGPGAGGQGLKVCRGAGTNGVVARPP